jgi:colanic acid/amylovoran biosynthesis glycosyltransferase
MRVVIVVNGYPVTSQTFIRTQFEGLQSVGVDCHLLDKGITPQAVARTLEIDERVHRLNVRARGGYKVELSGRALSTAIRHPSRSVRHLQSTIAQGARLFGSHWLTHQRLFDLAPDVVHYSFASYAVGDEHVPDSLGVPLVVSCRGFDLTHVGVTNQSFYERLWSASAFVHFRSQDLLRLAQQRGFDDTRPHRVTPPGIDSEFFAPRDNAAAPQPGRRKKIVSVGRLVEKKGHEVALAVVRALLDRSLDIEYEIIGSGDIEARLRERAAELGVHHVTQFSGELDPTEVRNRLQDADVVLHPSWNEGFGVAVLEAQSVGVPVVCSDAEGLPENVEHTVTGFVVARGNVAGMAARVEELITDEELASRLGRAGRARIVKSFGVEREIQAYVASYESVTTAACHS